MKVYCLLLIVIAASYCIVPQAEAYTLFEVRKRGSLICGVDPASPGFSNVDAKGNWSGFDTDFCRAVAAAVLGDATKVEFKPLAANEIYTALLTKEIDLLARRSPWTYTRDTSQAVHFTGVSYHDEQGFLVARQPGVKKSSDLGKVKICGPVHSPYLPKVEEHFERSDAASKIVPYDSLDLAIKGFVMGSCDLLSLPVSQLEGIRLGLSKPEEVVLLKDRIGKELLGPVVRLGDDGWFNIVRWTLFAMIAAEELGISSTNFEEMKLSNSLDVRRFFGLEGSSGKGLGLNPDWAVQIIAQVGNYKELFERHLGQKSELQLERGYNRLWRNGGLLYSPPLR